MAYTSIFKEKNSQPSTGYKSIFKKEPQKKGEIVNKTLPNFLGGGTYKLNTEKPSELVKTERTNYGDVPTKMGYERADIFPVSLGGINASSTNITYEPLVKNPKPGALTKTDQYLQKEILPKYKSGEISLGEAQVKAVSYLRDQQEGLDYSKINAGGKAGEIADKIVNFFKGIKKETPEPSTKDLAKKIAIPNNLIGKQTLKQEKPSLFKSAEFGNEMIPSKLQLPETNWAFKAINTIYNIPAQAEANLVTNLTKLSSANTPLKRVTGSVQTATSALGLIPQWLILSTGLKAAEEVPIIKYPAKAINFGFEKLGQVGSFLAGKGVDISPLSDETKNTIRPAVEELGALATQLLGAKKAGDVVGKFSNTVKARIAERQSKGEEITPEIANEVVNEVKQNIDTTYQSKTKQELIDKPTPENLEKAIETSNNLPPIKNIKPQEAQGEALKQETITTPAETFTPRLAESNKQKAIDLGVKESEFKNLPEVEKINLQEQFTKAKNYIDSDFIKSREILKGNEPVPSDINATQFLAAAEKYLKENPDKELAFEIANSELTRAASLAGQEVVSAKLREPDSFTAKVIELKKAREVKELGNKRSLAKKSLKEETNKINLTKEDLSWERFLDKIEC